MLPSRNLHDAAIQPESEVAIESVPVAVAHRRLKLRDRERLAKSVLGISRMGRRTKVCIVALVTCVGVSCGAERARLSDPPTIPNSDGSAPEGTTLLPDSGSKTALCDEAAASERLAGCHFMQVMSGPLASLQAVAGCFTLIVANPNDVPVKFRLRRGDDETDGAPYARLVDVDGRSASYSPLPSGGIPPRSIAVVFSLHVPADATSSSPHFTLDCPATAFIEAPVGTIGNASIERRGQAIELLSEAPVFVLNVDGLKNGRSGRSHFPPRLRAVGLDSAHALPGPSVALDDDQYRRVQAGSARQARESRHPDRGMRNHYDYDLTQWPGRTSVIAASEHTQVVFPELEGPPHDDEVREGRDVHLRQRRSLIGRSFVADKPIALVNATQSPLPWDFPFGDEANVGPTMTQTPPEPVWGSEYVAVRHPGSVAGRHRRAAVAHHRRGRRDDAHLRAQAPPGAPHRIDRGELAIFEAGEPFIVRSQDETHPFFFGGHMTGGHYVLQRNGRYPNGYRARRSRIDERAHDVSLGQALSLLRLAQLAGAKPRRRPPAWRQGCLPRLRRNPRRLEARRHAIRVHLRAAHRANLEPIATAPSAAMRDLIGFKAKNRSAPRVWALTTGQRVEISSVEGSWAYAVPLLGADGPTTASTQ